MIFKKPKGSDTCQNVRKKILLFRLWQSLDLFVLDQCDMLVYMGHVSLIFQAETYVFCRTVTDIADRRN